MKNIVTLLIVFSFLFFAYRSCTKGYDAYAFFVHVKDVTIFKSRLAPADTRIIERGRRLKEDIILMRTALRKAAVPVFVIEPMVRFATFGVKK